MILVGNKSDIWQERQVVTDKACQVVKMEWVARMILTKTNLNIVMRMMILMKKRGRSSPRKPARWSR